MTTKKFTATFMCFDHRGTEDFEVEEGKDPAIDILRQIQKKGCKTGIVLEIKPYADTGRIPEDGC